MGLTNRALGSEWNVSFWVFVKYELQAHMLHFLFACFKAEKKDFVNFCQISPPTFLEDKFVLEYREWVLTRNAFSAFAHMRKMIWYLHVQAK